MAEQQTKSDPLEDIFTLSESEHQRLRGLRVLQARLSIMRKLVNFIMVGWRVTGKKQITHAEVEPSYVDNDSVQQLDRLYKTLNVKPSGGESLEAKHNHFAKRFDREPFVELCRNDAEIIVKGANQSTDDICKLEFPDGPDGQKIKTRSLLITTTRYLTIAWLQEMILKVEEDENQSASIHFKDLLDEDQNDAIAEAYEIVDDWLDSLVRLNTEREKKYDEFAASKGQLSYEKIEFAGLQLIKDADTALVRECESWKAEEK